MMFVEDKASGETPPLGPSVKNLAHVLRHPELWPAGFEWNYGRSDCCAMGLADKLWGCKFSWPGLAHVMELLKWQHGYTSACSIFVDGNRSWFFRKRTKPHQIAKALEELEAKAREEWVHAKAHA